MFRGNIFRLLWREPAAPQPCRLSSLSCRRVSPAPAKLVLPWSALPYSPLPFPPFSVTLVVV